MRFLGFGKKEPPPVIRKTDFVVGQGEAKGVTNLYTGELSDLDPQLIKDYKEGARKGVYYFLVRLFDYIRRNDMRIGAVCQTRKYGVLGKKPRIICEDNEIGEYALSLIQRQRIKPVPGLKPIPANFYTDCVEANIQGVSIFELNYMLHNGKIYPSAVRKIQNHVVLFDVKTNEYKFLDIANTRLDEIRSWANMMYADNFDLSKFKMIDVHPAKILEVESFDGDNQNGILNGAIESIVNGYFLKNFDLKEWAKFIDSYTNPTMVMAYDDLLSSPQDIKNMEKWIQNILYNKYGLHPKTAEAKILSDQYKNLAANIHRDFIDYQDKETSIRILGQELTTDIGDVGSKAASQVADNVRSDIIIADLETIREALNALMERLVFMNFANPKELPEAEFDELKKLKLLRTLSEIYQNLVGMGYRVVQEKVEETFGVPVEKIENENYNRGEAPKSEPEVKASDIAESLVKQYKKQFSEIRGVTDKEAEQYAKAIYDAILL